jgi:hypothetical protein
MRLPYNKKRPISGGHFVRIFVDRVGYDVFHD